MKKSAIYFLFFGLVLGGNLNCSDRIEIDPDNSSLIIQVTISAPARLFMTTFTLGRRAPEATMTMGNLKKELHALLSEKDPKDASGSALSTAFLKKYIALEKATLEVAFDKTAVDDSLSLADLIDKGFDPKTHKLDFRYKARKKNL